jgi:hypothetical protein
MNMEYLSHSHLSFTDGGDVASIFKRMSVGGFEKQTSCWRTHNISATLFKLRNHNSVAPRHLIGPECSDFVLSGCFGILKY